MFIGWYVQMLILISFYMHCVYMHACTVMVEDLYALYQGYSTLCSQLMLVKNNSEHNLPKSCRNEHRKIKRGGGVTLGCKCVLR